MSSLPVRTWLFLGRSEYHLVTSSERTRYIKMLAAEAGRAPFGRREARGCQLNHGQVACRGDLSDAYRSYGVGRRMDRTMVIIWAVHRARVSSELSAT